MSKYCEFYVSFFGGWIEIPASSNFISFIFEAMFWFVVVGMLIAIKAEYNFRKAKDDRRKFY